MMVRSRTRRLAAFREVTELVDVEAVLSRNEASELGSDFRGAALDLQQGYVWTSIKVPQCRKWGKVGKSRTLAYLASVHKPPARR